MARRKKEYEPPPTIRKVSDELWEERGRHEKSYVPLSFPLVIFRSAAIFLLFAIGLIFQVCRFHVPLSGPEGLKSFGGLPADQRQAFQPRVEVASRSGTVEISWSRMLVAYEEPNNISEDISVVIAPVRTLRAVGGVPIFDYEPRPTFQAVRNNTVSAKFGAYGYQSGLLLVIPSGSRGGVFTLRKQSSFSFPSIVLCVPALFSFTRWARRRSRAWRRGFEVLPVH
jgi:hypothetical protein